MYTIKNVSMFGYAEAKEEDPVFKEVFATAKLLAEHGYTIVQGGGPGLMRAAGQGAKAGGGQTIGVTYYPRVMEGIAHGNFEGRDELNPLDQEIVTDTYLERTMLLMEKGDLYMVFNGNAGTVSEFGMAWGLAKVHFGHHKPFILYGSWWYDIMETFAKNMFISETALRVYRIVDSPEEALAAMENLCSNSEHFTC